MTHLELTGRLICENADEARIVTRHLPRHIERTRAEAGCLLFEVVQTEDPHIWTVAERFVDQAAFDAHQARVRSSGWGRATAMITRDYTLVQGER